MKIPSPASPRFKSAPKEPAANVTKCMRENTDTQAMAREGFFDTNELRKLSPEVCLKLDHASLRIPSTHRGIVVIDPKSQATLRLENHADGFRLIHFPKDQGKIVYTFNTREHYVTGSSFAFCVKETPLSMLEKPTLDLSDEHLITLLHPLITGRLQHRMPMDTPES